MNIEHLSFDIKTMLHDSILKAQLTHKHLNKQQLIATFKKDVIEVVYSLNIDKKSSVKLLQECFDIIEFRLRTIH